MHKKFLFHILSLIIMGAGTTLSVQAFSPSKYATTSKLATGKWVKVAIPENGIYQLTFDELNQMGFSNPESVRIYGHGGHPINEKLDGTAIDDLKQIPFKISENKIYFYANGPVKFTLSSPASQIPHFTREFNSYSTNGYYFITENDGSTMLTPTQINNTLSTNRVWATSSDYKLYEKELVSPGQSGKEMLGELMSNAAIDIPYSLPGLCGDSAIVVNICAAAKVTAASYIAGKINGIDLNYTLSSSKIYPPANSLVYYNYASPYNIYRPTVGSPIPQEGVINTSIYSPSGTINTSWLDYIIITYNHSNTLSYNTVDNQLRMGFPVLKTTDAISMPGASATTEVWNISNPQSPISYSLIDNGGSMMFSPAVNSNGLQFIAFDPSMPLKSISGYTPVENQNIHGMPTPDMIIVTTEELLPQAERIAQMHRDNDNMTVHVLDQQQVFNEFSSGTPDAMAIRLMNKMFYDRNSSKFQNLLMMGAGSYDNRQITFKKDIHLITYESEISNDEEYSYVCDDFYGILDDNTGEQIASEYLRLGVGRIPSASVEEATSNVDKLLKYVNEPDYGPWRNDLILIADEEDDGLHAFQTEGINNIIVDELATGMTNNKVYIRQLPIDPTSKFAFEARKKLTAQLKEGQYFMDYVGHAGPTSITKSNKLWTSNEAKTVEYNNLPIFFTACCDVARYDGNQRGIMEHMFHKQNGGAIALVTSARSVYAENNDQLNQAFIRAMFCFNNKGYMPTLGEAYKLSKQSFCPSENINKMSFLLLGDPALKINYPKPYFKITKINNQNANATDTIETGAMQELTVEAKVYNPDGTSINTNFNGDATLSIYDAEKLETSITKRVNRVDITRDIYYPRQLIARVNGRVTNGEFTGTVILPRYIVSTDDITGAVRVYAHQDDSQEMVNGTFTNLAIKPYDENNELTVNDTQPPVIEQIYFNDEQTFEDGAMIPTNSTLYIKATDDYAFNVQAQAVGNSMALQLDGGKTTYPYVKNYCSTNDEGKTLAIEFPLSLQIGRHTLTYTVYDAAGNKATRTISFLVGTTSSMEMTVEEEPATDEATFNITTSLNTTPQVTIKVVDNVGELVWSTTTSDFPYTWNLKDKDGTRVPAGVYRFYGTYNDGVNYGGTPMGHIIVIDPYKTNN